VLPLTPWLHAFKGPYFQGEGKGRKEQRRVENRVCHLNLHHRSTPLVPIENALGEVTIGENWGKIWKGIIGF